MGDLSGKGSQTIQQYPCHEKHWLTLPGVAFMSCDVGCPLCQVMGPPQPSPSRVGPLRPQSCCQEPGMAQLSPGKQQELHKLPSQSSSFLIRTWNNRWGKFRSNSYYVLAFISVHWLSLCCFMCAMKGQIKTHFSFLSILFLFFNYLSSYCIAATDGTLKMNSLFGNCILCSLFLPSKMTK